MTAEERAHVIELLRESEREFLQLVSPLSEAQWQARPDAGVWSVQETAEHLIRGERAMRAKIAEALAAPPRADGQEKDAAKTEFLERVLPNRRTKAAAPQVLQPGANWSREEALARYRSERDATLKFAEEIDRPLKEHCSEHPFPVFNMLNAYQWLLYIPLHNTRHNQQIAETLQVCTK